MGWGDGEGRRPQRRGRTARQVRDSTCLVIEISDGRPENFERGDESRGGYVAGVEQGGEPIEEVGQDPGVIDEFAAATYWTMKARSSLVRES